MRDRKFSGVLAAAGPLLLTLLFALAVGSPVLSPEDMGNSLSWSVLKGAFPSLAHEAYRPEGGEPCANKVTLCIS